MESELNKKNSGYKELLGYFSEYSNEKPIWSYDFVYKSSSDDIKLMELRKRYNLDLKSGKMDSFNKQLRIMRWVHEVLLNSETGEYNGNLTALDILEHSCANKKQFSCINHAIVLTQCLLSMGYYARYISCLPLDALPFDNHVLTEVYSDTLNKWIILDSTVNAYFTDTRNMVLSLIELRDCLIREEKINFNYFDRFSGSGVPKSAYTVNYSEDEFIGTLIRNLFVLQYKQINDSNHCNKEEVYYRLVPQKYLHANIEKTLTGNNKITIYRYTDNAAFIYSEPIQKEERKHVQAFNV